MKKIMNTSYTAADVFLEIFMWILSLVILIPFYYLVVNTFKTPQEVTAAPMALPGAEISIRYYITAWNDMNYPRTVFNNLVNTLCSVILIVLVGSMASYSLVRKNSKFHKGVYLVLISAIMIPFQMIIVPLMKIVSNFHLVNTTAAVVLVFVFSNIPFVIFLYCSFIKTLPYQLEEAATIDGASIMTIFWKICFPLLKPVTGTVVILQGIAFWNDFLVQVLFISKPKLFTLTRMIYANVGLFSTDWNALLPMFVLSMLPVLIFYILMQKSIVKGIAAGSLKG